MITVAEGERIECFRNDGKFIGSMNLINNRSGNCIAFKIKTNNTKDIHVTPFIGAFSGQMLNVSIRCEKSSNNSKLQIQTIDLGNQVINKNDARLIQQMFDAHTHEAISMKIEIITIENSQPSKSIISSQPITHNKHQEDIFYKTEFVYEQQIQRKKENQQQQQQQQMSERNSNNNIDPPLQSNRMSKENQEQRYFTSNTFQLGKQTPSKQSSNSQTNILQSDFPPKPQSYPHQPQQPKHNNYHEKEVEEDPYILRINQKIQQLTIEYNQQASEYHDLEKSRQLLLNNDFPHNESQLSFGMQHIFLSALIFFLIGYTATN